MFVQVKLAGLSALRISAASFSCYRLHQYAGTGTLPQGPTQAVLRYVRGLRQHQKSQGVDNAAPEEPLWKRCFFEMGLQRLAASSSKGNSAWKLKKPLASNVSLITWGDLIPHLGLSSRSSGEENEMKKGKRTGEEKLMAHGKGDVWITAEEEEIKAWGK